MGIKAGFRDDALFDIASVTLDDNSSPAVPESGQLSLYADGGRIKQKNASGTAKTVGPQTASEVDINSGTGDNTLIGISVQAVLDKYNGPTNSEKVVYLGNGEVDYVEFFRSATQTTGNRIAKVSFSYDGSLNPTSETHLLYDTDGTTVLKTLTFTHTFVSSEYDKTTLATS